MQRQRICHGTLDFIQVPGFPSAIGALALTPYYCSTLAVAYLFLVRRTLALCMKQTVNLNNYGNQDLNYPTR